MTRPIGIMAATLILAVVTGCMSAATQQYQEQELPEPAGTPSDQKAVPSVGADGKPSSMTVPTTLQTKHKNQTVERGWIMDGSHYRTEVYIIRSKQKGPTVIVVGGVHGNETSGWMVARKVKNLKIDAGTLVVIPEANKVGVISRTRSPAGDLNREFPIGWPPSDPLANAIWEVVEYYRPVSVMDLHESFGIRGIHDNAVGQTLVGHFRAGDGYKFAGAALQYVNENHVPRAMRPMYQFNPIGMTLPMLTHKAGSDLQIPTYIVEVTQHETTIEQRVAWQQAWVEYFLKWYGVIAQESKVDFDAPDIGK